MALLTVTGCGSTPEEPALGDAATAQAGPSAADLPPALLDELADTAAGALPAVAERIPAADAELVGRVGIPGTPGLSNGSAALGPVDRPLAPPSVEAAPPIHPVEPVPEIHPGEPVPETPASGPVPAPDRGDPYSQPVRAPEDPRDHLGERVLTAVRPALEAAVLDAPAELVPYVRAARPTEGSDISVVVTLGDGASAGVDLLDQVAPEVVPDIAAITGALADHERVAPLLRVGEGSEPEIVAAHGRAHLALAVVVSAIVVPAADVPAAGSGPEVVVGAALDAVTRVLPERPMPATYAAALRDRRRAEYQVPNVASGEVTVNGYRFGLAEGALPAAAEEPANGLVTVVPGGLVVRTGTFSGSVPVSVQVLPGPPPADGTPGRDLAVWHEVVEVSFTAQAGGASIVSGAGPATEHLRERTPPWPGPVRARVAARGRDDAVADGEGYEITLWAAPPAPEVVLKATDRLGHRLRGEPEPPVVERPESAYRWLGDSPLGEAATVTVVTGSTVEEVVTAFGGDPARPIPVDDGLLTGLDPWVSVLPGDGAVIAVEPSGWQGANDGVLRAAAANGRAASMYWNNADALTNLAFARDGEVLDSFEPLFPHEASDGEVRAALDGIDWVDYTDLHEKGLVAVEEFTGHGIRAGDVDRIETAYLIPDHG